MTVRCKLKLVEIRSMHWSQGKVLVFNAEYDSAIPEDQRFAKASPNGRFEIHVDNPTALTQYELGRSYYFDSTPVPDATAA